jgi:hypothetical protein
MTPKTTREHIISLHGHVTGLKKDIANLKTNHLKHMCLDIKSLGGKIDNLLGSISNGGGRRVSTSKSIS